MDELTPLQVLGRYPGHDGTLRGAFDSRVGVDPGRPFLIFEDRTWSWEDFGRAAAALGEALSRRGVRPGERVAIMAGNSDAHVLLVFALAGIGAIVVPVNPEFGVAEAAYVLGHARVAGVVCSEETLDTVRRAIAGLHPAPWLARADGAAGGAVFPEGLVPDNAATMRSPSPDDTFAIIYTSGTTGFPKGVMHSQRSFVLAGERHVARVHLQPDDRTLCVLPMFHVNALFNMLASVVAAGACLVVAARFSASQFWRLAADTGATQVNVMAAVSTILARRPRSEFVPGHRLRVANGSGFTEETLAVFKGEFGIPTVIEGLGMTEIPGAFSNPFEGPHKLACMGKPGVHPDPSVQWTQARLVDDEGRDVPEGAVGEVAVRIPTLMQGYWRDPEQTAAAFRDGWFMTGDLARRDADGYYHFVSRKKDIIRRRGENISAAELDRIMALHPAIAEAAAVPVPAELGDEDVMAVVVAREGAVLTAESVRDWCAERLAAHKLPRYVAFVAQLPHTPTHKVARHLLKQDPALLAAATDLGAGTRERRGAEPARYNGARTET